VFWICVSSYIFVSCLVFFILYLCVFYLGCDSLAPNDDIVTFRCQGESYTLFPHIFVKTFHKFFNFCIVFLGFRVVCAFLIGFFSLFAWLLVCM